MSKIENNILIKNLRKQVNIFEKIRLCYFVHEHTEVSIRPRSCYLLSADYVKEDSCPGMDSCYGRANRVLWWCGAILNLPVYVRTYVHTYVCMHVWEANTMGCAATIISREYLGLRNCASIGRGRRQRDLILQSDARLGNMILSTGGVRAMMRAAKTHLTALRVLSSQPRCYPPRIALQLDLLCNLVTLENSPKTRDECC